jgi:tetratricopeptide (TPR) repeat protein
VAVLAHLDTGKTQIGTGFLVGGGLVLTTEHCVRDVTGRSARVTSLCVVRLGDRAGAAAEIVDRDGVRAVSADFDIALLTVGTGSWQDEPRVPFARVDRSHSAELAPCEAVGFPLWQVSHADGIRNPVHVSGRIRPVEDHNNQPPNLVLRDPVLDTVDIGERPGPRDETVPRHARWRGVSGALVFCRGFAIGVVVEHDPNQGRSSLRVRPLDESLGASTNPGERLIFDLLGMRSLNDLPSGWEAQLAERGLHVWTEADFRAAGGPGHDLASPPNAGETRDADLAEPVDSDEYVNVTLLREGRLPNLDVEFRPLIHRCVGWLAADQKKRGRERLRMLWITGEPGVHRSKALLACLARPDRTVYDAGRDPDLAAATVERIMLGPRFAVQPLIGVDLYEEQPAASWRKLRDAVTGAQRRLGSDHSRYPRLVVAGTVAQAQEAHDALTTLVEINAIDVRGRPHQRPGSDPRLQSRDHVFNRGMPMTARRLFGRRSELAALREAWHSGRTRVVSIVAYGGTGKSALVNTWLGEMQAAEFLGAQKVLAWSFYSQGTKDNLVSADPFVTAALSWLGDDSGMTLNPWARGRRLAALIRQHDCLLVLDGVEPLQHPLTARHVGGQLTDDSIRALLEELAKPGWGGLCVVTTRVPLTDIGHLEGTDEIVLENLDLNDGADLLRYLTGTQASLRELRQTVREVDGHALAVTLLGNYLRQAHGGDLAGRFDLEKLTVAPGEGGHARRVMDSYTRWLKSHGCVAELALLHVIGLFDRPAPRAAMAALLADGGPRALIGGLDRVGDDAWSRCVDALRGMGLLNNEIPDWPGTLDAHPLVREHFRDELRREDPSLWLDGNSTLFRYYRDAAPPQPAESTEMSSLFAAVTHGCAAGLHQKVFDSVLLPRVWRDKRTSFSTRRLGMTGSDLVALSNFFRPRSWTELRHGVLAEHAAVLVLTNTGVRLRQLGRLQDAQDCFGAVVRAIDPATGGGEEMEDASYAAAAYCELLVIAGRLTDGGQGDTALENGRRAVEYADRGNDPYFRMHARSSLAEVQVMLGNVDRAAALFDEAMSIERMYQPRPPFLYSQGLYRYGYFLIEAGRAQEILRAAEQQPDWGTNGDDSSLLSRAIRLLTLGAAHRSLIEAGETSPEAIRRTHQLLDDAVSEFRTAGYADYFVRGLLERAHFHRIRGQDDGYLAAHEDLDKATIEARRGQMELLVADTELQRLACHLQFWPAMTTLERDAVRDDIAVLLARVTDQVATLGYGRRRAMLDTLWNAAGAYGVTGPP